MLPVFIAMNILAGLSAGSMGMDSEFYWHMMAPNLCLLGADLVLGLVVWRAELSLAAMRKVTMANVILETGSTLLTGWGYGIVNSHMVMFGLLLVFFYRAMFDFATGTLCLLLFVGVIHRDLKPENIFLSPRGDDLQVKILDFGVSKIRGEATVLTQEIALLGTPDFMSPEQATGVVDDLDSSTDIFALGAITYYALTGVRPFQATSVPATLRRICDEAPIPIAELRPDVPAGVADVLTIALAKKRAERYVDVSRFAAALAAALRGEVDDDVGRRAASVYTGTPASRTVVASVSATAPTEDGAKPIVLADTVDSRAGSTDDL